MRCLNRVSRASVVVCRRNFECKEGLHSSRRNIGNRWREAHTRRYTLRTDSTSSLLRVGYWIWDDGSGVGVLESKTAGNYECRAARQIIGNHCRKLAKCVRRILLVNAMSLLGWKYRKGPGGQTPQKLFLGNVDVLLEIVVEKTPSSSAHTGVQLPRLGDALIPISAFSQPQLNRKSLLKLKPRLKQ